MKTIDGVQQIVAPGESTLGELLRRTAYAQLPATFYWLLQLCVPLAFQLWVWGWHRAAGWLAVASAFGVWALAQQRLEGHAEADDAHLAATSSLRQVWRVARGLAGVGGSLITLVLLLEGFSQLMAIVFKCPGCAG